MERLAVRSSDSDPDGGRLSEGKEIGGTDDDRRPRRPARGAGSGDDPIRGRGGGIRRQGRSDACARLTGGGPAVAGTRVRLGILSGVAFRRGRFLAASCVRNVRLRTDQL